MKNFIKGFLCMLLIVATASTLSSCKKDLKDNGLEDATVDAGFTITPISGTTNRYTLTTTNNNFISSKWDIGIGAGDAFGDNQMSIFLPDAGTYAIKHTAISKGGKSFISTNNIVVPTSDPIAGNLVLGGKLATAADQSNWTILNIGAPANFWSFSAAGATVSPNSWNQQGLYQGINVVANKQYKIDMVVSSTVGIPAGTTWFEVYANTTVPVQGTDYTSGGRRMGISTWDGCGLTPFSGLLSTVGCVGSGNIISFTTSGTIYLVIKAGSGASPNITIKNIEMRGI